jgi:hypothetical protein
MYPVDHLLYNARMAKYIAGLATDVMSARERTDSISREIHQLQLPLWSLKTPFTINQQPSTLLTLSCVYIHLPHTHHVVCSLYLCACRSCPDWIGIDEGYRFLGGGVGEEEGDW